MNPTSQEPTKKLDDDLETFEAQPAKIQELEELQDLATKTIGPEKAAVQKEIHRKAGTDSDHP